MCNAAEGDQPLKLMSLPPSFGLLADLQILRSRGAPSLLLAPCAGLGSLAAGCVGGSRSLLSRSQYA